MKRLLAALAALLLLASCSSTLDGSGADYGDSGASYVTWEPDQRGDPVEASGTLFSGDELNLADLRGEVVVVNTWYAACPPCRSEAPDLVEMAGDYPDVAFVGVNTRDDSGTAAAFDRTFEIPYDSVHGSDGIFIAGLEGSVPLQAVPTTLILDREGRPAARYLGRIDASIVRGMLDDVLAEQ